MKLVRFEHGGGPRIGVIKNGGIVDLVAAGSRWTRVIDIAGAGAGGSGRASGAGGKRRADLHALSGTRLLAPIERPGKYLAIGMNYAKHLEEADRLGVARAKHQTWFNKQTTCISGPYDDIDPGGCGKARLRGRAWRGDRQAGQSA